MRPGDLVIVLAYCGLAPEQVITQAARVVLMRPGNAILSTEDKPVAAA